MTNVAGAAHHARVTASRYRVPMDDLDAVRVPVDEQVASEPEPPHDAPLAAEELDRQRLLGITGAGRLRRD